MIRAGAIVAALLLLIAPVHPSLAASQPAAEADAARVALIARAKQSVVHVKAKPKPASPDQRKPAADDTFKQLMDRMERGFGEPRPPEGSGFVVDSARGLVLTAAHLVADAAGASVVLADGGERPAAIVAVDKDRGIALLRIDGAAPPALALALRPAEAGETVLALGWMLPLKTVLALDGMVAGPAPGAGLKASTAPALVDYVALDLTLLNGAFGGGPVLDRNGAVIGMVSAIFGRDYGPGSLTLMIPAAQIAPRLEALRAAR